MAAPHHDESPNARFLAGTSSVESRAAGRVRNAFSVSMLAHTAGFLLILLLVGRVAGPVSPGTPAQAIPDGIVWIVQPGPGGGGGGGGERKPKPARVAQSVGQEPVTIPVTASPPTRPEPAQDKPAPPVTVSIPAIATSAGIQELPGLLATIAIPSDSRGSGAGPGAGTGTGPGIGAGDGAGLNDGLERGTGGDVYEPGSGVSMPRVIYERKPNYTNEAMRAKVQGAVMMEAVVMADGSVGPVQVTHSLDRTFGLDEEAVRTVKLWRFLPGRMGTKPVPVRVAIEMRFTLR